MKICIAKASIAQSKDSRFTIIRSNDRQGLIALRGLNIDGPDPIDGDEPEVTEKNIHIDDDRIFTAYRDVDDSESDDSIIDDDKWHLQ